MGAGETRPAFDAAAALESTRRRRLLALWLLLIAGLFSGLAAGMMIATVLTGMSEPQNAATVETLRRALAADPSNAALREAVRAEDLRVRGAYFAGRRRLAVGAWLLLAGLTGVVLCARWYAAGERTMPVPGSPAERADAAGFVRRMQAGWAAVALAAAAGGGALLVLVLTGPTAPSPQAPLPLREGGEGAGGREKPPQQAQFKENWPIFRGPTGMGIAPAGDWPLSWDAQTGAGIVWKAPVPMPGKSSPILWGDRLFLTGADANGREVMCFDRASGVLLWRTAVPAPPGGLASQEDLQVLEETGYAASTPATDGRRVYALFATADLAAVDFSGKPAWVRRLGAPENSYGIAVSPIVHDGSVIVQFDRGAAPEDDLSALLFIDPATGATTASVARPAAGSWATPIIAATASGPQLVAAGKPWVIAYDPRMAAELWRCSGLTGDVAPSPVYADGMVFVTNEYARLMAIRTDGSGDVTSTHVVWQAEEGMSDASSPVCDGKLFLQAHSSGRMTCYDARAGRLLWETRLDGALWASPTLAGGVVYLPDDRGRTHIFRLADSFAEIAAPALGEPIHATPAFADGHIYVRTQGHLFCIGGKQP